MTSQARQVVINLDLEDDLFAETLEFLKAQTEYSKISCNLDALKSGGPLLAGQEIELVALYTRRADSNASSLSRAVAAIEAASRALEINQVRHLVRTITLVDCSEIPAAPLSDFTAIARYLEVFSQDLAPGTTARVLALDHDFSAEPAYARLYDTQSTEFLEHFVAYTRTSLQMLNTGFGNGKLPD